MKNKQKTHSIHFLYTLMLIGFYQSCAVSKHPSVINRYQPEGYKLVWSDEFTENGRPDAANWRYEEGFVRNKELQWYQKENAFVKHGKLIIEARKENRSNPYFIPDSRNWRTSRSHIGYTSACLITKGLQEFKYGRFEMRGKIDVSSGLWPAFWTLGVAQNWPANGEIDIMEYYQGKILANIASSEKDGRPKWFSNTKSVEYIGGKIWANKFHIWRMDWDEGSISLYVDDVLLNKTPLISLQNENASTMHPFKQKHYLLLDLALGGMNGGDLGDTKFPNRFEIDYVRVYQKR